MHHREIFYVVIVSGNTYDGIQYMNFTSYAYIYTFLHIFMQTKLFSKIDSYRACDKTYNTVLRVLTMVSFYSYGLTFFPKEKENTCFNCLKKVAGISWLFLTYLKLKLSILVFFLRQSTKQISLV